MNTGTMMGAKSEKLAEFQRSKAGILDNSAHGDNLEPSLLQSFDGAQVRDPGNLRPTLRRDFHSPQILFAGQLLRHFEVLADGFPNVRQCLLFGGALRPAPGEPRAGNAVTLFGWN